MKNLRRIRKEKGFTCESLGLRVNVQKSAISKYERGEIQPSKDVLVKLAEVLDCSVDYLLDVTDVPRTSRAADIHDSKKSDAEEFSDALKKIFVDAKMISPDEKLSNEFKEFALQVVRASVALHKRTDDT